MTDPIRGWLDGGALLLDAAMGTRLIALGLDIQNDDPSLWNLSRPGDVARVHASDVEAGARAILTNTFGANRAWLARLGRAGEVGAINRAAARLAREAIGDAGLVLGSIGPTAADAPGAVREQAEALTSAGADALFFETFRLDQADRALRDCEGIGHLPRLVSLFDWPEPIAEAVRRLIDLGASAVGVNCLGLGPSLRLAERIRSVTDLPLIVKPSAGRPGEAMAGPESFARAVPALRAIGPLLLGGCCGTTEAHVAALRSAWYSTKSPIAPEESPT